MTTWQPIVCTQFNRARISGRASLRGGVAPFMPSRRAGIPEKLNNRRMIPFIDGSD